MSEQTPVSNNDVAAPMPENYVPPAIDPATDQPITPERAAWKETPNDPATPVPSASSSQSPDVAPAPEPEPAPAPEQPRQLTGIGALNSPEAGNPSPAWLCVTPEGPRTNDQHGRHPVFHSDEHLVGRQVICPTCGGTSVRQFDPAFDTAR